MIRVGVSELAGSEEILENFDSQFDRSIIIQSSQWPMNVIDTHRLSVLILMVHIHFDFSTNNLEG